MPDNNPPSDTPDPRDDAEAALPSSPVQEQISTGEDWGDVSDHIKDEVGLQ